MPLKVLIVGGDGLLGRALFARLSRGGQSVLTTTRREAGDGLFLDLAADPLTWPELPDVDAAVIAGGVTSLVDCARDPAATAKINVGGTVEVVRRLADAGAHTLFLSSSQVFDGTRVLRPRNDERRPVSEYGRQKAAAEERILELGTSIAVLRVTKVMDPTWNLLRGWRMELEKGREVHPFSNFSLAPVQTGHVISLIEHIVNGRATGIFQLSGDIDLPYAELAIALAKAIGAPAPLIQPTPGSAEAAGFCALPRYSSLDMEVELERFGMKAPNSREVIDQVIAASIGAA